MTEKGYGKWVVLKPCKVGKSNGSDTDDGDKAVASIVGRRRKFSAKFDETIFRPKPASQGRAGQEEKGVFLDKGLETCFTFAAPVESEDKSTTFPKWRCGKNRTHLTSETYTWA